MREILAGSVQYILVPVITATELGVIVDPTNDAVLMTFCLTETLPASPDWTDAVWVSSTDAQGVVHYSARVLVGPGALELDPGIWWPFVQIGTTDETPQLRGATPLLVRATNG